MKQSKKSLILAVKTAMWVSGKKQKETAEYIGVSQTMVSNYLSKKDKGSPSESVAIKLAALTGGKLGVESFMGDVVDETVLSSVNIPHALISMWVKDINRSL